MYLDMEKIIREFKDANLKDNEIISYLKDKKINNSDWAKIIANFIKGNSKKIDHFFYRILIENMDSLAEDICSFIYLLTVIADKPSELRNISNFIMNVELDIEKMKLIYKKILALDNEIIKEESGIILGKIGLKNPEFFLQEINEHLHTNEVILKKIILKALYISSYKPYRNRNLNLSKEIFNFIISSIFSDEEEISLISLRTIIQLFDLHPQFLYVLRDFITQSDDNKIKFLESIHYNKFYDNDDKEYDLLCECSITDSTDVTKLLFTICGDKFDADVCYKKKLQKLTLDLIKKWHINQNFDYLAEYVHLLENVAKTDIKYTFEFIKEWISNDNFKEEKSVFYKINI
jgi:hypothetical protein